MSGYCFPISRDGSHFYRDCCQHLKQQPVYLAISCSVARWEWECPGRERKHQGWTWRQSRVETTNFPQEGSACTHEHKHMNTKCIRTYRHMHTDMNSATHTHTHTQRLFLSLKEAQGSWGLEAVAANWVLTGVLCCVSCLMRRCQSHQLIYQKTIAHWLTLTFIGN